MNYGFDKTGNNYMKPQEKRLSYIDIAKGFGIILVVIGHISSIPVIIRSFIYQFHMPLFFILSGFFYKEKYDDNPKPFVYSKIKTLYFSYVKYSIILLLSFCIISFFVLGTTFYSFLGFAKVILFIILGIGGAPLGGILWFLRSLLLVSLLFVFMRFLLKKINIDNKKKDILLFIAVSGCLIIGFRTHIQYCNISTSLVALFFYYVGYLYKKYNNIIKMNEWIAFVCFAVVLFSSFVNNIDMVFNSYSYKSLFILSSLCGTYFILYICKSIKYKWGGVEYIGRNSLIIMAFHFFAFKLVNLIFIVVYKLPLSKINDLTIQKIFFGWIVYLLAGIAIPLFLGYCFEKINNKLIKYVYFSCYTGI